VFLFEWEPTGVDIDEREIGIAEIEKMIAFE
jgi:hypothetical protein